jgi:hypothetical protein
LFGYRVYLDDGKNLCLKGRGFYFFYVLAIMLTLCVGLPIAASGMITVRDTMIIGRRSFTIDIDEMTGIIFARYRLKARTGYRIIVQCKDGENRFLDEENIFLLETQANEAMRGLRALLAESHRDGSIPIRECSIEEYALSTRRPK